MQAVASVFFGSYNNLMPNVKHERPVVLVVYDQPAVFSALIKETQRYDVGRLWQEFEFVYCDCLAAIKGWYERNRGRFVALLLIGADFSRIDSEEKLVPFPTGLRPAGKVTDIRAIQGFIIFQHLRHFDIDRLAPAVFIVSPQLLNDLQSLTNLVHCPGYGAYNFLVTEAGDEIKMPEVLGYVEGYALKPLTDEERRLWRERHEMVLGYSRQMAWLAREIQRLGPTDSTVLILGEPGVGKELVAHALHRLSFRYSETRPEQKEPVTVSMTTLERNIALDELFGHVSGAFTDARTARLGILETAKGSTVFLDEIGEIDQEFQARLLRAIEYHRIKPLGSSIEKTVDIRVVAATNRSIEELQSRFRQDFYSRLVQKCITVPSLAQRWQKEKPTTVEADIAEFFEFITERKNRSPWVKRKIYPDPTAVKLLTNIVLQYLEKKNNIFQGNIRTLTSLIEGAYERAQHENAPTVGIGQIASTLARLSADSPQVFSDTPPPGQRKTTIETVVGSLKLADIEKMAIKEALSITGNNQTRAAHILGIHRDTLRKKMRLYRIE